MPTGDTFVRLHNIVGHLREAHDEITGLFALDVLQETDAASVADSQFLIQSQIDSLETISQRYLLEED